jgi:hypothetical protein
VKAQLQAEHGSALLVTLVLGLAVGAATAALAEAAYELAAEVSVRRQVLCARYASLSGLAFGLIAGDGAGTVDSGVTSISITAVLKAPGWCVVRSIGVCGEAQRTIERTVGPENCA